VPKALVKGLGLHNYKLLLEARGKKAIGNTKEQFYSIIQKKGIIVSAQRSSPWYKGNFLREDKESLCPSLFYKFPRLAKGQRINFKGKIPR
jgi:hypothetical protein